MMKIKLTPSEFKNLKGIEYFKFEEDFIEENVRCIPMIVRFKIDAAGIKLKLAEWSRFLPAERVQLALLPVSTQEQTDKYHQFLIGLITKYTGNQATTMPIEPLPEWGNLHQIPAMLKEKMAEFQLHISINQWRKLTNIQRFALLKLCRPGHENKNFPKAMAEFGLLKS
ncbi:nitrate reductase associated protein [Pedobacter sp. MR2016-19]|uniref:nitrate reductase associated protein n=1 Tax=Pedobacter sp. MR2016-19 TaxID=2780089 RepID=UPI001876C644|nr:nitrate reductase associated protein [Pedobacter sp. MR2016-19]MBE5319957.1 nitrate reductase associated protein [Pedobacter sp. MR2016-19]